MKDTVAKYKPPAKTGYTVYSISGCKFCKLAKEHIAKAKKKCKVINCDTYIETLRKRHEFYAYINQYTGIPYTYFPMVFHNGKFVGGYKELAKLI
jgi:glutaredoxin